jgi:hypothetical protein
MQSDDFVPGRSGAPDLQTKTVVGVFENSDKAVAAAHALRQIGLDETQISVVAPQSDRGPEMGAESTHASEGGVAGAGTGAVVGGLVAGLAALAIPGVGPLLAAGPIAAAITAALGGALVGAGAGVLAGSFSGLGVPKEHAEQYEHAVRGGGAVVAVKVPFDEHIDPIQEALRQQGAHEVTSFSPAL